MLRKMDLQMFSEETTDTSNTLENGVNNSEEKLNEGELNNGDKDDNSGDEDSWDGFEYQAGQVDGQDLIKKESLEQFIKDAKDELGLKPKQTKQLLDYLSKHNENDYKARNESVKEQYESWENEIKSDSLVGGKNYEANVETARRGIEWMTGGNKKDMETLKELGILKLPAVVRMAYRVGKANSEDKIVNGSTTSSKKDPLKSLYPSMYK